MTQSKHFYIEVFSGSTDVGIDNPDVGRDFATYITAAMRAQSPRRMLYRVRVTPKPGLYGHVSEMAPVEGWRSLWKVTDAVVVWLSHHERINGRFTVTEIAAGINGEHAVYGLNLDGAQVNAAISGISIRSAVRHRHYLTDIDMGSSQSVHARAKDGLNVRWQARLWSLTTLGIAHAQLMKNVKTRKLEMHRDRA